MVGPVSLCWILPGGFDGSQELCPLALALYSLQRNLRAARSNQRIGHDGKGAIECLEYVKMMKRGVDVVATQQ
jgi:hypothetical protein